VRFNPSHPEYGSFTDVYVDESSQTKHQHLLIGSIAIATASVAAFEKRLAAARLPELPHGELAWVKVSRTKLAAYKRMVDVFFDSAETAFHCLYVDTSQQDHRRFNEGSREIGFNKEIYQLLNKVRQLYSTRLFHCYPDKRSTNTPTEDLRLILNRGARKDGDARDYPFRRVAFRDSDKSLCIQLVDVILGAVAYHINGHHQAAGASPAKCELAAYILRRAGVRDAIKGTSRGGKFTIWPRQLRKASRSPRP
jgi:hypothetical protein